MPHTFSNLRRNDSDQYYYKDDDIPQARIPVSSNTEGDIRLSKKNAEKWFGISENTMPRLPKFLIAPRLESEYMGEWRNPTYTERLLCGRIGSTIIHPKVKWWKIKGEIAVYEPIEWVPDVEKIATYPRSEFTTTITESSTTMHEFKFNSSVTAKLTAKGSKSFERMAIQIEANISASTEIVYKYENSNSVATKTTGTLGNKPIHQVAVRMKLQVRKIYSHPIDVWCDKQRTHNSLGWGRWTDNDWWNDICVPSSKLEKVKALQFNPAVVEGPDSIKSLFIQVLPVLNTQRTGISQLHIALSSSSWKEWYAYNEGSGQQKDSTELIAWDEWKPMMTYMTMDDEVVS